jgi:hypothetical protein
LTDSSIDVLRKNIDGFFKNENLNLSLESCNGMVLNMVSMVRKLIQFDFFDANVHAGEGIHKY